MAVDTREKYGRKFAGRLATIERLALPAGDYGAVVDDEVVAVVDRKTLENLATSISDGSLSFLSPMARCPSRCSDWPRWPGRPRSRGPLPGSVPDPTGPWLVAGRHDGPPGGPLPRRSDHLAGSGVNAPIVEGFVRAGFRKLVVDPPRLLVIVEAGQILDVGHVAGTEPPWLGGHPAFDRPGFVLIATSLRAGSSGELDPPSHRNTSAVDRRWSRASVPALLARHTGGLRSDPAGTPGSDRAPSQGRQLTEHVENPSRGRSQHGVSHHSPLSLRRAAAAISAPV